MPISPQAFTVGDLYRHRKITEIAAAPGRDEIVATVRSVQRQDNRYGTRLWTFSLADSGTPTQQLTHGPGNESAPCWSPDGSTLAFISTRTGSPQVHVLPRAGGEAAQVGNFDNGVSDMAWFPDGRRMLATAAVPVDCNARGQRTARPEQGPSDEAAPEVAWKLPYKADGVGYLLRREIRLFRLDVDDSAAPPLQLTDGAFDVLGCDVSPDGARIAYVRTSAGRFAHRYELWLCDADGQDHRPLVQQLATVSGPVWSPDGQHIALTGAAREGEGESTLWLLKVHTGELVPAVDESLEVAAGEPVHWSDGGRRVVFCQAFCGRHRIASVALGHTEVVTHAGGDRQFGAFATAGHQLAYTVDHPSLPSELWICSGRDGQGERQVSQLNPWWSERVAIRAEVRSFDVPDGDGGTERIEGWLLAAEGTRGPAPLLNDVHGGPASYALMDFDSNVFWQVLCARGWRVLALNAVGSASFGRRFSHRLAGRWGGLDLPQHLAAIDALAREGLCDDRVAISGKCYGGYLSAWTIGHTDRFKAAVVMAPVGNIETHYGTSDGGYYADPFYLGAAPRFDRAAARRLSPLQYVEKATTPTLFLQGKDDERCPKCQSEELFVSLMRAGDTPTELVLYPGEGHGFLGQGLPACRADAAQRIVDWLEHHVVASPRHGADAPARQADGAPAGAASAGTRAFPEPAVSPGPAVPAEP